MKIINLFPSQYYTLSIQMSHDPNQNSTLKEESNQNKHIGIIVGT
jgi:hypothetical protein